MHGWSSTWHVSIVLIYFRSNRDLNQLVCPCVPKGSWMKWKVILPVGNLLIFVQLAMDAWKDLKVFWQLNNVNFQPINILLQFGSRRIFSTLIKRREQHLSSAEEAGFDFHPWKSPTAMQDPTTGDIWSRKNSDWTLFCSLKYRYLPACHAVQLLSVWDSIVL